MFVEYFSKELSHLTCWRINTVCEWTDRNLVFMIFKLCFECRE